MMSDEIIKAISAEMRKRSVTVYRLAKESGVSTASISGILSGENSPTLTTLEKLLKPLGLKICVSKSL